jgi:pimeloyl-ACP methyl ester carboxylesterase
VAEFAEAGFLEIGGGAIHYQVAGQGNPLVLVHGLSGSTRWWARNVQPLAQHFRVYVVDLIGFGSSRAAGPFMLREAAGQLLRWMDGLDLARASVIGHSMGGFIAAELAADATERVDRLVLVDAVALPLGRTRWQQAVGLAHGLWRLPVGFLPILLTDAGRAGPRTIARATRELLTADIQDKLAHVTAPTLLVWGEYDAIVPPEIGERLMRALPGARLLVFGGAGHNPMWDRADAFNQAILEFLTTDAPIRQTATGAQSAA